MTKGFSVSLGVFISLFCVLLFPNKCISQMIPSLKAVHAKKGSSLPEQSSSLTFDGSNDKITTTGTLDNLSGFSLELWLYPHSAASSMAIIGENNLIEFGFGSASSLRIWTNDGNAKSWSFNSTTFPFNTWHHIVAVGDATSYPHLKIYVNGELKASGGSNPGNTFGVGHNPTNYTIYIAKTVWGTTDKYYDGSMDEIRVWGDVRSQEEIKSNMFKHLDGDESNLQAYYQMSSASGTTLVDNSANSYDGTISSASWGTNYVPLGDLLTAYQTDMEGLWEASGTTASQESDGLSMSVGSTLAEANFAIFGNNNTTGTSTSDLPSGESLQKRSSREWQVDEIGTVSASVVIDISDATGNSVSPAAATNYKLLYKSCTECDFTVKATGASSSDDIITFSNVALQDGFYAIASTDSNL